MVPRHFSCSREKIDGPPSFFPVPEKKLTISSFFPVPEKKLKCFFYISGSTADPADNNDDDQYEHPPAPEIQTIGYVPATTVSFG